MNRASPLTLTGDWQVIPFASGASTRDMNTFPVSRYDYTNQLIWPNQSMTAEQSYSISLDLAMALNTQNTYVKLSVRFMCPVPGSPIYFPLPDSLGRVDMPDQVVSPNGAVHFEYPVYSSAPVRQYGAQLQIKSTAYRMSGQGLLSGLVGALVTALSGNERPTLTDAVLNMYAL